MLHIPHTNLLLLAAKQEPYKKSASLNKKILKNFLEKVEISQQAEKKDKTERVTGLVRKTRDSKVESNDSPEIPDRGDIRHPRPPFGTENRWVKLV